MIVSDVTLAGKEVHLKANLYHINNLETSSQDSTKADCIKRHSKCPYMSFSLFHMTDDWICREKVLISALNSAGSPWELHKGHLDLFGGTHCDDRLQHGFFFSLFYFFFLAVKGVPL